MKLLIIGGNGMAGHMLVQYFRHEGRHSVFYTSRDTADDQALLLDVTDMEGVDRLIAAVRPQIIINAVGILNEACEHRPIEAYLVNALLPHRLQQHAAAIGARVIHISTDCVFAGTRGSYRETDSPDGTTTYAVTKTLGELRDESHLTIRTSIIGPEIRPQGIGLLQWFLRQRGPVQGYRRVLWNGISTLELAQYISQWLDSSLGGIVHLARSEAISKYELLKLIQAVYQQEEVMIWPQDTPISDKTLLLTRQDVLVELPSYSVMLKRLEEGIGWS